MCTVCLRKGINESREKEMVWVKYLVILRNVKIEREHFAKRPLKPTPKPTASGLAFFC